MKKIFDKILNPKKKGMKYDNDVLSKDAVPEPPRNLPVHIPPRSEMYQNFNIDTCRKNSSSSTSEISYNSDTNSISTERQSTLSYNVSPFATLQAQPVIVSNRRRCNSTPLNSNQDSGIESEESQSAPTESLRIHADVSQVSRSNLVGIPETTERVNGSANLPSGNGEIVKMKQPTCTNITINGSRNFHIGSQKTVYFYSNEKSYNNEGKLEKNAMLKSKPEILEQLIEVNEVITKEQISIISLSIKERWNEFGRNLGLNQTVIDEIELTGDNNSAVIIYDMLQTFIKDYPNTSLGFVVNVLKQSNQIYAIEQLAKER